MGFFSYEPVQASSPLYLEPFGTFHWMTLGVVAALASLIFANDDGAGPDRFRFYQYFGTHAYIVLTIVYFAAVRGYRIRFASLAKAVGILFPITIAMRFFDLAFAGPPYEFNYMFLLRQPPDISTPFDSLGGGWGYYFAFIGICTALLFLLYLPWSFARRGPAATGTRRAS
ncbi:MAG: YwaF family protein [Treponema sp.]|nr:YwaF family protein [Treponema sp.]